MSFKRSRKTLRIKHLPAFIFILFLLFFNIEACAAAEIKINDGRLALNSSENEIKAHHDMNINPSDGAEGFFKLLKKSVNTPPEEKSSKSNNEALMRALNSNDTAEIKNSILKLKEDKNLKSELNEALFYSAAKEATAAIEILLNAGADINYKDSNGFSVLMHAAANNKPDSVKLLIKRGVKLNEVNYYGMTALMCAAGKNSTECAELLINAGASVEAQAPLNGINAFMIAVGANNIDTAKLLIKKGANMNVRAKNNRTALMLTTQYGYKSLYKILKDAGAIEYPYIEPDYK